MGTDSVVVTVQREICGYESTDLRTVTAHEQGMTIGSDDGTHGIEASGGIAANCAFVSWVRVRLDDRDARPCEQPSDKGANHCAAKTSAELICLGQELINPLRSRIGLALPPTSSTLNDDLRLDKANGFAVQVRDVRSRCVGLVNREKVVAAQLINRVCWSPPYSDMGTKQPFMKNGEVIFPKRPEVKARPTRVSRTVLPVAQRTAGGVISAGDLKSPKRLSVHAINELLTGVS
jgi:hypothetical protein